jgi:glycosyltransferase involved in cell wall biosynthesis
MSARMSSSRIAGGSGAYRVETMRDRSDHIGQPVRLVYFHRNYLGFSGGHLKVWDYFNHVNATERYRAKIFFTPQSIWADDNPWLRSRDRILSRWRPHQADIVFLAGLGWLSIDESERHNFSRPVINLVQGIRHSDSQDARFGFLGHRAIRICVSQDVAAALCATGQVNGPVFTIPNGLDLSALPKPAPRPVRPYDFLIVGPKAPLLADELAGALRIQHPGMRLLSLSEPIPRRGFLEALGAARAALFLPSPTEGFYLPALEAMMMRTIVLCPDVGGNRCFCRDGETAIVPSRFDQSALLAAVDRLITLSDDDREALVARAARTAASHDLSGERAAFHEILTEINHIW